MRALVVYESMYGNTHVVADHIAAGLRRTFDVDVVPVTQATPERVAAADLVVVGGPTHVHGMSTRSTRTSAAEAARKAGSTVELDIDATGEGLRDWFHALGEHSTAAAAFDTRFDVPSAITGRASGGIARRLRRAGFSVITSPKSFFVDKKNELLPGEARRAAEWGAALTIAIHAVSTA